MSNSRENTQPLVPHNSVMDDAEILENQPQITLERLGEVLPPVSDESQVQIGGYWAGAVLGRRASVQDAISDQRKARK